MASNKKKSDSLWKKLQRKYRLVVLNDETFEEQTSVRLSKFNVYATISSLFLIVFIIAFLLIIYTPLNRFVPGYNTGGNANTELVELNLKVDSLEHDIRQRNIWSNNVRMILKGEIDTLTEDITPYTFALNDSTGEQELSLDDIPDEDIALRNEIDEGADFILNGGNNGITQVVKQKALSTLHFFPPITGYVTSPFDAEHDHFGIDIVAPENEEVKVVLDGTIITSTWTLKTGHIIAVQHENNLISFYKHNSVLLKKVGNFVSAGDVIAIIGGSGELSSGPHLHFELWHNGAPIDPLDYINF